MPEKYLRVTMPDGSKWDIPARVIAADRAKYYTCDETRNDPAPTYEEEFEYSLSNDYELHEWAADNMNWSDVAECAFKVEGAPAFDFQEGWMNGKKEIVTK